MKTQTDPCYIEVILQLQDNMLRQWLGDMLTSFPTTRMAFAYGSGVFAQQTAAETRASTRSGEDPPMIDLVLVVDDPVTWHEENILKNRHHYSFAAYGGAPLVARLQDTAARVWYNALVPVPAPWGDGRQLMKYGVISSKALEEDLRTWSSFYISGRMQKPVAWIDGYEMKIAAATPETQYDKVGVEHLATAGEVNLRGAVAAALLLLPERFTEGQLYETITGLSYAGDFRMAIAENPDKVRNIVHSPGSPLRFHGLYAHILQEMEARSMLRRLDLGSTTIDRNDDAQILGGVYEQDISTLGITNVLRCIPMDCQQRMSVHIDVQYGNVNMGFLLNDPHAKMVQYRSTENDIGVLYTKLEEQLEEWGQKDIEKVVEITAKAMQLTLSTIVSQTALQQTMKGLASAGVTKSAVYSMNKIRKRLK